ncbi:MAG: VWA domain-containing protein [Eubacteriales bacterium]|nr:VWA domain-containing protein [Eubacteriales bacterium]
MKNRIIALLLCVTMLVSLAPAILATEADSGGSEQANVADEYREFYNNLMACTTLEEANALLNTLSDEEFEVFVNSLSEDEYNALNEHMNALIAAAEDEGIIDYVYGAVNFTNVAPLVEWPAVTPTRGAYSLNATGDGEQAGDDNGLVLAKNAQYDLETGGCTITLEAYTTGTVTTEVENVPTDIVLVLDQSGSMEFGFGSQISVENANQTLGSTEGYYVKYGGVDWSGNELWYPVRYNNNHWQYYRPGLLGSRWVELSSTDFIYISRLAALKNTVSTFADAVADKAKGADGRFGTEDDVNHRIAVVGFASDYDYGYSNTEVFVGSNQYTYNAGGNNPSNADSAQSHYASAFQDMNTQTGYYNVQASKNALDAEGGTITNLGLEMANGILDANPVQEAERNRVIVVFTDGVPGRSGYDSDVANAAITQAWTAKNTNGATVYTVGIFGGADATSPGNKNGDDTEKANWFMQNVSSNNGAVQDPSYYLSAGDTTALNSIFTQISNQVSSPAINLGTETVVRDILSPYFNLPEGTDAESIRLYTADYNGTTFKDRVPADGITATVNTGTETIEVRGFDFTANFVSETTKPGETYGKKLIIEFDTVFDRSSTFGGNGIPTNADASGVYSGNECVEYFVSPTVDIPIVFDFGTSDSTIYLSQNANAQSLVDVLDNYTPNGTNNAHVNIVFTITRGGKTATLTYNAGKGVGTWSGDSLSSLALTDCTDFTVSCTVTPINKGTVSEEVISPKTATIHVLRPTIVWEDIEVYLGDRVDLDTAFYSVSWTDAKADTTHTAPEATGTAPVIAYTYSIYDGGLGSIGGDIYTPARTDACPINVSVTVGGMPELDGYVTSYSSCGTHPIVSHTLSVNSPEFYVHVKTCSITITKLGYYENLQNGGQTFLFEVVDSNNAVVATVAIGENGSATVVGLPVGTYTVREVNAWSWRYKAHDDVTVTLNAASPTGTAKFENVVANSHWLSGDSFMRNLFSLLTQG